MTSYSNILSNYPIPSLNQELIKVHSGHINDSYIIQTGEQVSHKYFLQKINGAPFTSISEVMQNIELVIEVQQKNPLPFLKTLEIVKTNKNNTYFIDEHGFHWRIFQFLEDFEIISPSSIEQDVHLMGKAYGGFLHQLRDVKPNNIHVTIPQFHALRSRIFSLQKSLKFPYKNRDESIKTELKIIEELKSQLLQIDHMMENKKIPITLCHNDTKSTNVMIHKSKKSLCVIDLDTVMPGTILYDYGDSIRSIISNINEDDEGSINLQWNKQKAFHEGFMDQVKSFITTPEMDLMPLAMVYMPFIMGVRFLTDYLDGDIYYNITKENQNLMRARNQLLLSQKIAQASNFIK